MKRIHLINRQVSNIILGCFLVLAANCKKDVVDYSLKVDVVPYGSGTISLSPEGGVYPEGTKVTLIQNPGPDYQFSGWGGPDADYINGNIIVMSKDMEVTADFNRLLNIMNGTWTGMYKNFSVKDALGFNVKDGKITSDGSQIVDEGTAISLYFKIFFTNMTMTSYFLKDVEIEDGNFELSSGSESYIGGKQTITGVFTTDSTCKGKVKYDESSSYANGHAEFDFEAKISSGPVVTTSPVSNITINTADCGGNVMREGISAVIAKGVCWSTSQDPTVYDSKTSDGIGTGLFTSSLGGLTSNTTYYVRAYATNSSGTTYGEQTSFSTADVIACEGIFNDSRDGQNYCYKGYGTQIWMTRNLAYLPSVSPEGSETVPYYYVYGYEGTSVAEARLTVNYSTYGVLYNLPAALTACPSGWHLPTDAEWTILTDYLTNNGYGYGGSGNDIGKSMAVPWGWQTSSGEGKVGNDQASNNSSNFSIPPGGFMGMNGTDASFLLLGIYAAYWSSTISTFIPHGSFFRLFFDDLGPLIDYPYRSSSGYSVRCLKD